MSRPRYEDGYRRPEPRVIDTGWAGAEVYAPWCEDCESDADTQWDMRTLRWEYPEGWCRHCERTLRPSRAEVHYIREPQRLSVRLAELRAEARTRSVRQSGTAPEEK